MQTLTCPSSPSVTNTVIMSFANAGMSFEQYEQLTEMEKLQEVLRDFNLEESLKEDKYKKGGAHGLTDKVDSMMRKDPTHYPCIGACFPPLPEDVRRSSVGE
jgi:hypothetical protein